MMRENYQEYAWTRMTFGRHRGKMIKDIPDDYLKWGILNLKDQGWATVFSVELQRRHPNMRKSICK